MRDGFESLGRVRLQGITLLAIAFAAGAVGGMAVERLRASRARPTPPEWMPVRGDLPPGFRGLDLTAEQRERIQEIFRASGPRTDSVLRASLPRLEAIHDSVRLAIRDVLTPEQRRRFDEMGARGPRGRGGFRNRPGFPGAPPGPPGPDSGRRR
jgi:Spy/CpxP family protein refolding chaperone